jgi:membrane protein DedA with SNARE-associated domain
MRVPLHKFMLYDFLGCLVSIPIWLTLGALASIYGREWLDRASGWAGGTLLAAFAVAIIVFLVVIKVRGARRARRDQKTLEAEVRLASEASQRRKAVMADEV